MSASEALFHPVIVVYKANAKTLAEKPYRYQVQIIWQHDYENESTVFDGPHKGHHSLFWARVCARSWARRGDPARVVENV